MVPCSENDECFSGWCVDGPDGTECTKVCDADCPDYTCRQVTTANGDPTYICLYDHVYYCSPCETGEDCAPRSWTPHTASSGRPGRARSARPLANQRRLSRRRDLRGDRGGGHQRTVCRPTEGVRVLRQRHRRDRVATCSVTNDLGTCEGARLCDLSGLTACDAAPAAAGPVMGKTRTATETSTRTSPAWARPAMARTLTSAGGTLSCADGALVCEDAEDGDIEVCNGEDDDCDGTVDESFANIGLPCDGEDVDTCLDGVWICNNGAEVCDDDGETQAELCNGADDDCDGALDETFPELGTTCDGRRRPVQGRQMGVRWSGRVTCDDSPDDTIKEVCNDVDDDCDGVTDEGFPDKGLACDGGDNDLCQEGVWQCGEAGLICTDNSGDNPELCNGQDDDCDRELMRAMTSRASRATTQTPICAMRGCGPATERPGVLGHDGPQHRAVQRAGQRLRWRHRREPPSALRDRVRRRHRDLRSGDLEGLHGHAAEGLHQL